jgi:hypothetical protein
VKRRGPSFTVSPRAASGSVSGAIVAAVCVYAAGCSLLFDGSDLRGDRDAGTDVDAGTEVDAGPGVDGGDAGADEPDAGSDAGAACPAPCTAGECCIDGACVLSDDDGDGYPSACAPFDCDDTDATVSPWPPLHAPMWQTHALANAVEVSVMLVERDCAVVAGLGVNQLVIDAAAGSALGCRMLRSYDPGTITCSAGVFSNLDAIDVRTGSTPLIVLGGLCGGMGHVVATRLDDTVAFDRTTMMPPALVALIPEGTTTMGNVLYTSFTGGAVSLVSSTEEVSLAATTHWLSVSYNTAVVADGMNIRLLNLETFANRMTVPTFASGRATIVQLASLQNLVFVPVVNGENTDVTVVGPFASVGADGIDAMTSSWAPGTRDPLFAGASLGSSDGFVLAGALASGVRVRIGDDEGALESSVLDIPLDESGFFDLAIDTFDDGDRVHVVVAAGAETLQTTRFSICAPAL